MKSSKFSESQIVTILKLAENGMPITEVCRSNGVHVLKKVMTKKW